MTIDTRVDPAFPRNAIHASFGIEHVTFDAGDANQPHRRHARLSRPVRPERACRPRDERDRDAPLPEYEQGLLGGAEPSRLRRRLTSAGDNIAALSAELRIPITSPLSVGRFGIKAFVDAGTVIPIRQQAHRPAFDRGYGGGVYLHLTIVSLSLDVARGQETGDYRFHFGMGVTFK